MKVTCEITDRSKPAKENIRIHNTFFGGDDVEVEINGERYTVNGLDLISAVNKCMLNNFGR